MIIEAMYDNGRLLLPNHLSFAHHRFSIKVEVPEVEIIWNVTPTKTQKITQQPKSQTLIAELRAVYKEALAATDASDDDLSEKQNARWASTVMYSSIKEQGTVK